MQAGGPGTGGGARGKGKRGRGLKTRAKHQSVCPDIGPDIGCQIGINKYDKLSPQPSCERASEMQCHH